jgi:hypothetical protein
MRAQSDMCVVRIWLTAACCPEGRGAAANAELLGPDDGIAAGDCDAPSEPDGAGRLWGTFLGNWEV